MRELYMYRCLAMLFHVVPLLACQPKNETRTKIPKNWSLADQLSTWILDHLFGIDFDLSYVHDEALARHWGLRKKNLHLRDQYKIPLDPNKNPWKPMKVT